MTDHTTAPAPAQDENRLIAERRAKLAKLRETGVAYPNDFVPDARAAALHDKYDDQEQEALAAAPVTVKVAGRMMLKRVMGKASFATLQDSTGRIQIYLDRGTLGEDSYAAFKQWDIGDIIAIDIPNRSISLQVSDEELAHRRAHMEAKGKDAWKPAAPRKRKVSTALKAYAAMATSAAKGAVRAVD